MVVELHEVKDELTPEAEDFIIELYDNVDPHAPFSEQLIGLPEAVDRKLKWLYSLYDKHINFDPEAAREYWEDDCLL